MSHPAMEKILARCEILPDGCWQWTGARAGRTRAHGKMWWEGKLVYVHRLAYEASVGPILGDLTIDHLCRNGLCVNPDHLEPVTRGENVRRASLARQTCPQGHPYDRFDGKARRCSVCTNEGHRRKYRRRVEREGPWWRIDRSVS